MIESNIEFNFNDKYTVIKFDDTNVYGKFKNSISNGKGVDFIAYSDDKVILMEIKNCSGHESGNQWRVDLGTKKNADGSIDECFDLEVAKKVSCTLSCLMGAGTFDKYNRTDEQEQLCQIMNMLTDYNHTIEVILFLEGDFEYKTRRKTMIMEAIQKRLKGHFKGWFNSTNCKVIDSNVKNNDVKSKIL